MSSNSFNPYEPPRGEFEPDLALDLADKEEIRRRVLRPGTALLIMGSIYSVFPAIYLVSYLMAFLASGVLIGELLGIAAFFFTALMIAIGGAKMAFMESYSMARIAAILACIPMISPFVVWGIPFGIWALIVLWDPQVQAAFEAKAQERLKASA